MPIDVIRVEKEPVAVRIDGQEFACDEGIALVTIPKVFLTHFLLSDIPDDIIFKPVDKIEGHTIQMNNAVALSQFSDGSATASIEEMFRRKFWDGDLGLSPYVAALRESIGEDEAALETDFQDDDDYIFLHYDITMTENLEIGEALDKIGGEIAALHIRADQLVARRRDRMLGIFDRGSFDPNLAYALRNPENRAALIMIDIDHFKHVNDSYGHQVGDKVLQAVADVLLRECPCDAVPYRFGGEELCVLVKDMSKDDAVWFAEFLRMKVEKLTLENQSDLRVTVSIGVAVAPDDGNGCDELIKKTDKALYTAKHDGRNRICSI
jgi:diguanylate cyclase (GGDEF)-like protein